MAAHAEALMPLLQRPAAAGLNVSVAAGASRPADGSQELPIVRPTEDGPPESPEASELKQLQKRQRAALHAMLGAGPPVTALARCLDLSPFFSA